jgi:glutamine synthetase
MKVISEIGGQIKYGHAEVGNIISENQEMVQQEIEFLPTTIEEAADNMVIAKWALREVAYKYGLTVSFAPKIIVGHAGSGMHFHIRLVKDGVNMMVDENGLNDTAKKLIGGILKLAPSLTAFGNTVPTSYLRLVPHQEAPTQICWGDRNRSVLVRVPLGWIGVDNMIYDVNPLEPQDETTFCNNQTVELRSPDGSCNIHQLLAGMAVAARYGLTSDESLNIARDLYISEDASSYKDLNQLPNSCFEAADQLIAHREIYEEFGVFPRDMIDGIARELKKHADSDLSTSVFGDIKAIRELVDRYMNCG